MKNKLFKTMALITSIILIIGLSYFANALLGNPISKMLATNTAKKHLTETYSNTDYYIERVAYNFKDGNYHVFIKSPTSIDTEFSLYITMFGKLRLDTYEDVLNGFNTARRIEHDYRELTDTIFEHPSFPYTCHISYGTLEIYPEEAISNSNVNDVPSYAINQNKLEFDKIYEDGMIERVKEADKILKAYYEEQDKNGK